MTNSALVLVQDKLTMFYALGLNGIDSDQSFTRMGATSLLNSKAAFSLACCKKDISAT
jgi:hypothetical protein